MGLYYQVHLFLCSLTHIYNQPITWQQINACRHGEDDLVKFLQSVSKGTESGFKWFLTWHGRWSPGILERHSNTHDLQPGGKAAQLIKLTINYWWKHICFSFVCSSSVTSGRESSEKGGSVSGVLSVPAAIYKKAYLLHSVHALVSTAKWAKETCQKDQRKRLQSVQACDIY